MNELNKKLFYFPANSAGPISAMMVKNQWTPNKKLPFRYYSEEYPSDYRIPAYLTTAGHLYKKEEYIKGFDFPDDCVVFGDSGGFQIATGKLKYTDELREKIFRWLENNSTIAANLDIPPKVSKSGHFDECLGISYNNFKYFEKHQSGKTKFLNVLQGLHEENYLKWYNRVCDFEFNGWAIGVDQRTAALYQIMAAVSILMDGKEHEKKNIEWIHFLGVTGTEPLVYLTQVQKSLEEIGSHVQISTDSSTPNISAKFGGYFIPRGLDWQIMNVPRDITLKGGKIDYQNTRTYPPVYNEVHNILRDEYIDTEAFVHFKSEAYAVLVLSNMATFVDVKQNIHNVVHSHEYFQEQILSTQMFKNIKLIDKIIKSDNPRKEFQRVLPQLTKHRPKNEIVKHEFFVEKSAVNV